ATGEPVTDAKVADESVAALDTVGELEDDGIEPGDPGLVKVPDVLGISSFSAGLATQALNPYAGGAVVIAIDPGHDRQHAGAHQNGLKEEDINLAVAYALKAQLEKYAGVRVIMTVGADGNCPWVAEGIGWGTCNQRRVESAVAQGANYFISIHMNSSTNSSAAGAMVLVPNANYNLNNIYNSGRTLGDTILARLAVLGINNRGLYYQDYPQGDPTDSARTYPDGSVADYYQMVREPKKRGVCGIIIEHLFLSNPAEASFIANPANQQLVAQADAEAIAHALGITDVSQVSIKARNDFNGTLTAQALGLWRYTNVASATFKVWPTALGEAAAHTYEGILQTDGSYTADVNIIADFGGARGEYTVSVTTDAPVNGNTLYGQARTSFSSAAASISDLTPASNEKTVPVALSVTDAPPSLKNMAVAVWSLDKDQDDLVWYTLSPSGNSYKATIDITKHKSPGAYAAHYYCDIDGFRMFVGAKSFNILGSQASGGISSAKQADGRYKVTVSGVAAPSGITKIEIPTWSTAGGQDDIYWYPAVKESEGVYSATLDYTRHNYASGEYLSHVYITSGNNLVKYVGGATYSVQAPGAAVSASLAGNEQSAALAVTDAGFRGNPSKVDIAVWSSEGGQDDLIWYSAANFGGGTWKASANIALHKTAGSYNAHAYGNVGGKSTFLGGTSFTVTGSSQSGGVAMTKLADGRYKVTVKGVTSPSGIAKVEIPTWSLANGQDDLYWYPAAKESDGVYSATLDWNRHSFLSGDYSSHVYVYSGNGVRKMVGALNSALAAPSATVSAQAAANEMTATAKISNASFLGNPSAMRFAVWSSEGGQDDLRWYSGVRNGAGEWNAGFSLIPHHSGGTYNVHVYGDVGGRSIFLGASTFAVKGASASAQPTAVKQADGGYKVAISGLTAPSGISRVSIPTWSIAKGQDDIYWYPATKEADGTYSIYLDGGRHGFESGAYISHVYAYAGNGAAVFVGGVNYTVDPVATSVAISDVGGAQTDLQKRMEITGLGRYGPSLTGVQFAVWSSTGGQDDLKWYTGTKNAAAWSAVADIKSHHTAGTYNVHIYAAISGKSVFVGSSSFSIANASGASIAAQPIANSGGKVQLTVTGINAPSGISKVQLPVWSRVDQSDIRWYDAAPNGSGGYTVTFDPQYHKFHAGDYIVHVYATMNNGIVSFTGGGGFTVSSEDFDYYLADGYEIMGQSGVTAADMVKLWNAKGKADTYPAYLAANGGAPNIDTFATIVLQEANAEGVKAEVVFAQCMKETGWLQFGGAVSVNQFNFAGLGATGGGAEGASFPDVRTGVRAQVQHLKAYASAAPLNNPCVDTRFNLVTRNSAKYVQWLGQKENPNGYGWATAADYGKTLTALVRELASYH
ncbi:MAG: GBS Bsp-like repeat-containing protein, partial [Clostridiales Family XIII bacterium]|nr:GBS Bsp-like repeat-containing protein [Clostridiales Family XIII bacterium]